MWRKELSLPHDPMARSPSSSSTASASGKACLGAGKLACPRFLCHAAFSCFFFIRFSLLAPPLGARTWGGSSTRVAFWAGFVLPPPGPWLLSGLQGLTHAGVR